jgi:phosphorylcholine metabolism protein LicD
MVSTRIKGSNLKKARKLLKDIVCFLEKNNIDYHLEGGTLLGFFRDGEFLEWDHDIDLSIPSSYAKRFYSGRRNLLLKGYRITNRRSITDYGPIKKDGYRIFKVKRIFGSFLSMFSGKIRDNQLVADIFIKYDNGQDTYWIASKKVMKVPSLHYKDYDEVGYMGKSYRIPVKCSEYLTHKFGDWSVPVKDWDCSIDEKSVVGSVL